MRRFEVIDGERTPRRSCGILSYDFARDIFEFEAADWAGPQDVPAMFSPSLARGERTVGNRIVSLWVEERIAPPGRQNIGEVLRKHNLTVYDPGTLLANSQGKSVQDGFFLRELGHSFQGAIELGQRLYESRMRAGMSQARLAEVTGIPQATISLIERGGGNPTMKTLERLADGVGADLEIRFIR